MSREDQAVEHGLVFSGWLMAYVSLGVAQESTLWSCDVWVETARDGAQDVFYLIAQGTICMNLNVRD
jgi:hypothetical protein